MSETLIAARWGRYRQRVGEKRRLRPGDTGSIQLGRERFDFQILNSELSFRPILVEPGDAAYLGSLSMSAVAILLSAAVAWFSPPLEAIELIELPNRGCFGLLLLE